MSIEFGSGAGSGLGRLPRRSPRVEGRMTAERDG